MGPTPRSRRARPQCCFRGAGSGRARQVTILPTVSVDTNDSIFASGVAFCASGLPEPFQDIFARDPVEAWEVDFARAVHQVMVDSLKDVVCLVLAVVSMCWNQAFNVCQWVHEHIQERVSVISAAKRFTDFVAMPPLSILMQQALVWAGLLVHSVTFTAGRERERPSRSRKADCGSVSPGALAPPSCRASSRGWASEDEI